MKKLMILLAVMTFMLSIKMKAQCASVQTPFAICNSALSEIDVSWIPANGTGVASYGYNQFFINGVLYFDKSCTSCNSWPTSVSLVYLKGSYVAGQTYKIDIVTHAYNEPNYCNNCASCVASVTITAPASVPAPTPVPVKKKGK
jgi:hypothetical protein